MLSKEEWFAGCVRVVEATGHGGPATRSSSVHVFGNAFDALLHKLDAPAEWSASVQVAIASTYDAKGYGPGRRYHNERLDFVRTLRLGHAAASGDPAWVARAEAASLPALLPVPTTTPPTPPDGDGFPVPFRCFRPGLPRGARSRMVPFVASGTAWVDRVSPDDAPVTYVLGFSRGRGEFEVREREGALYRPVFPPGSLAPMDEATFLLAAGGDDAWRDNCFLPRFWDTQGIPLRDYAREPDPDGQPADLEGDASAEAVRRCGRLLSIDGRMYRETDEPMAFATHSFRLDGHHAALDWRLGDMDSRFDPDPFARNELFVDWTFGCGDLLESSEWEHAFPAGDMAMARDVAAIAAGVLGCDLSEASVSGGVPSEDPVEAVARRMTRMVEARAERHWCLRTHEVVPVLGEAVVATARRDLPELRRIYASIGPCDRPKRLTTVAERAYVKALVAVAGRAVKGAYSSATGDDLDVAGLG